MTPAITPTIRWRVFLRDNFRCRYCHATGVPLQVDHIIPRSAGGSDAFFNLITACGDCNLGKGATDLRPEVQELAEALWRTGVIRQVNEEVQATLIRLMVTVTLGTLVSVFRREVVRPEEIPTWQEFIALAQAAGKAP